VRGREARQQNAVPGQPFVRPCQIPPACGLRSAPSRPRRFGPCRRWRRPRGAARPIP
jgi:hypothetical protein